MTTLLDMLNRGGPGVPQRASPLTAAVQQSNAVQQTPLMRPSANRRSGPGLLDTIWGVAAGYSPGATRQMHDQRNIALETAQIERDRLKAQRDGLARFAGSFGGGVGAAGSGGGPATPSGPSAGSNAAFDPRSWGPQLLQLEALGVDTGPMRLALSEGAPDVEIVNGVPVDKRNLSQLGSRVGGVDLQNVNGFQVDPNDPNNVNRFLPEVGEGMAPVIGAGGAITGINNIPGAVDAAAGRVRAVQDATNASEASYAGVTAEAAAAGRGRGESPYDLVTVQGPNGPISMSRAQALGEGVIQGVDTSTSNAREERNEADLELAVASENLATRFAGVKSQVENGAFNLSPTAIAGYEIDLSLGRDNPQAAAYGLFRSNVQEFVNENLRLNKGVQTEGDAQRDAVAIMRNIANPRYVIERMGQMQARNEQRSAQARQRVERRSPGTNQGIVSVTSIAQAQGLPAGTRFRAPNGREYVKD